MLSVGPQDQLHRFNIPVVHHLPGVGQNLRDHPIIYITWRTKRNILSIRSLPEFRWRCAGPPRAHLCASMMIFWRSFLFGASPQGQPCGALEDHMLGVLDLAKSTGELRLQIY